MNELTVEQKVYVRNLITDPVLFATNILGSELWEREIEISEVHSEQSRTAIRSCHGAGKTYSLALCALWWLARYPEGIVLTTSPTLRQVRTQMWSEIHRIAAASKVPYPELRTTELKFRGDDNFALGLSTNQAENFQGYHGKYVLIIVDEAPGIAAEIWDAIAGAMAGGKVHIVLAGNPTTPSGLFFDAFNRERGLWNCITIDAFDSPNLKSLTLEQLLQMDPATGGPLDQNVVPFLVTKRWVYDQYLVWWHGDERSSPSWMSRVRGQFPEQSQDALIKLSWLERAKRRALEVPVQNTGQRLIAGVDVGGVNSETVVYVCEVANGKQKVLKFGAWRGEDTRGRVVAFLRPYHKSLAIVRVDADGVGYNFGLHLRDQGLPVEFIHVGIPVKSKANMKAYDPALRFSNRKAQMYQCLADMLERDEIDGLIDDTTIGQLSGIQYEIDSRGRIMIESKEKARQRGVASPDRAEALMLALGKPMPIIEWHSIRELGDPKSPFFDGADGDDRPLGGRRWDGYVGNFRWGKFKGTW